jgi:hypothetical protein
VARDPGLEPRRVAGGAGRQGVGGPVDEADHAGRQARAQR